MNKVKYCKKIKDAIKDEEKGAREYLILELNSSTKTAVAVFHHISNQEGLHKLQLEHLYPKICQ